MQGITYTEAWQWGWLAIQVALAVGFALLFHFFKRFAGGMLGVLLGLLLSSLTWSMVTEFSGKEQAWWILMIILICFCGGGFGLGCWLASSMIIIATSIYGGWTFTIGVGTLTKQFPFPP